MKWFIEINEEVSGPFSSEEVFQMEQSEELALNTANVWSPSLSHWLSFQFWKANHANIQSQILSQSQEPKVWFYTENKSSKPKGAFNRTELLGKLTQIGVKDKILLWRKGMKSWKTIFSFPEFIEVLEISRRKHPRKKIDGKISLKDQLGNSYIGQIDIISPGGCGISKVSNLNVGETYKVEIKSNEFDSSMQMNATILSSMDDEKWNLKFEEINDEAKSTIISFVNSAMKNSKMAA